MTAAMLEMIERKGRYIAVERKNLTSFSGRSPPRFAESALEYRQAAHTEQVVVVLSWKY